MRAALAGIVVKDIGDAKRRLRIAERERDRIASFDVMLVRERLADDDGVGVAQLGENIVRGTPGKKIGIVIRAQYAQFDRAEPRGHAFVADFVFAQPVDGRDSRQRGNLVGKFRQRSSDADRRRRHPRDAGTRSAGN